CAFALLSFPTTRTSSGDLSGVNASRFSLGSPAREARIMSHCHEEERYSAMMAATASESAAVHRRGLYPRMRNSGGNVLSVSESMYAFTPLVYAFTGRSNDAGIFAAASSR